jgi:hypothetical protein
MSDQIIINEIIKQDTLNIVSTGSAVISVNSKVGNIILSSADVGLSAVDNTSDLNKPISYSVLSALLLKTDVSVFNQLNNLVLAKYGNWDNVYAYVSTISGIEINQQQATTFVLNNSANIQNVYSSVNATSANWNTSYNTLSTLSYTNTYSFQDYYTLSDYLTNNIVNLNKGSTITLADGRIYAFAGTDPQNPNHYLEVNANAITPIYQEVNINDINSYVIDEFYLNEYKSSKYVIQIETNFDNSIYYSEINILGSISDSFAVASEYGQISTNSNILGYTANFNVNKIELILLFGSSNISGQKYIIKGHRTNFFKI